jgi:uncharacterized protein (TIGR02757 family)
MDAELAQRLEELAARPDPRRLAQDPLGLVRAARDREAAALVAALLAFGNAAAIRGSVARALAALDGDAGALRGFRHRWIGAGELRRLLGAIRRAREDHRSLEGLFAAGDGGDLAGALDAFAAALRGRRPSSAMRWLLPRPADGSACKRPLLFLRWVARPDDGVDLGLWTALDPARLVVPLDTHVHRIGYWIGLTSRRTASWRTALEVTAALRALDPADPTRFDFALAHLGISRDCPGRPEPRACTPCPLRAHCRAWRGP